MQVESRGQRTRKAMLKWGIFVVMEFLQYMAFSFLRTMFSLLRLTYCNSLCFSFLYVLYPLETHRDMSIFFTFCNGKLNIFALEN